MRQECYNWEFDSFPQKKKKWWNRLEDDAQGAEDYVRQTPLDV